MKFAISAVFTLALAMSVQSSIIPLAHSHLAEVAGHGLSYTAVSSPVHGHVLAHAPGSIAVHASPALHGGWVGDLHGDLHGDWNHGVHHAAVVVDGHHLAHGLASHAHLVHGHEGQYIAKTRGAVHAAPLAGHIASAAAINVAPAPGTW